MDNLSAHDFNDLQGPFPEGHETPEEPAQGSAGSTNVLRGTQDLISTIDSKTVVTIARSCVKISCTNALQKHAITVTRRINGFLISNNVTIHEATAMLTKGQLGKFEWQAGLRGVAVYGLRCLINQ